MTFLFVLDDVYDVIESAMRALSYFLCKFIYELIVSMYNIFDRLCNSRILDSSVLQTISERVGILLGIIMLFMVAFSVIQMILDPDKLSDKEKGIGNILKKIILVIVMLGVSSFAFSLMYGIQKKVIDSNIIQRFLLPYEIKEKDNFGGILSYNLFNSFFYIDTDILSGLNLKDDVDSNVTQCYTDMYNLEVQLKSGVKDPFQVIDGCVNKAPDGKYIISFNWILAPLVGAGVLYFIFNYCISVGIRTIQLAFLEIMAPMAIISYLSPKKDNMFQKWIKLYFSTYLDVFLRIMIINLIVFLIMTIFENSNEWIFWNSVGGKSGTFADIAIQILMIFALLTFAKKAPDLIKDLFPAGASKLGLGISSPKKMFDNMLGGNLVKSAAKIGTVGTAIGLSNALTSGFSRYQINKKNGKKNWQAALGAAGGVFSGLGRGFVAGNQKGNPFSVYSKGVKAQRDLNDKYDEMITSGGSTLGKISAGISANFGETKGQEYTRIIRNNEEVVKAYDAIDSQAEKFKKVKIAKAAWETAKAQGKSKAIIDQLYDDYKKEKATQIDLALNGHDFGDGKENAVASQITVSKNDIVNLIKSGQVRLTDKNNNVIKENGLTSSEILDYAAASANKQNSDIKIKDDYATAIANDRAAGVNSNGSGKK